MAAGLLLGCPPRPIPGSGGGYGPKSSSIASISSSSRAARIARPGNGRVAPMAALGKVVAEDPSPCRCQGEMAMPSSSRWDFAKVEVRWTLPATAFVGVDQVRPLVFVRFVAGMAVAVSAIVAFLAKSRLESSSPALVKKSDSREEKRDFERVEHEQVVTAAAAVSLEEEERIAKIRDMARQALLDDVAATVGDGRENAASAAAGENLAGNSLRLAAAAAAGSDLARKHQNETSETRASPDFVELARQLDHVRESGSADQEETVPGPREIDQVVVNGHSTGNELAAAGRRSRFITTYEEACEVLRSEEQLVEESSPSTSEASSSSNLLDRSSSREDDAENGSVSSSSSASSTDEELRTLRRILIKAQENERKKKPLFHGLPPDAKDTLLEGLTRELGSDAEPIKDWIMEQIATDARKKPREDETDEPLPTITGRKKSDQWEPDCNPPKTIVTGSRSGATQQQKKESISEPKNTKNPNKNTKNKKKKKVWPKELQRRYDAETDPKTRKLMKEIGKDLDEWLTEEEVDETIRLFFQGPEGRQELLRRWHLELKEEAKKQGETIDDEEIKRFEQLQARYKSRSLQSMASKYRYSESLKPDTAWWLKLRYVACVMLQNEEQKVAPGLYSMNMALEGDSEEKLHVVGFEDHNEALNFCRSLVPELDKLGGATGARVIPFEPKELLLEAKESDFQVTVLKKGQVENYVGKPFEEVEYRILEIGRDVYVQERLRERSIDVKSMMSDVWNDIEMYGFEGAWRFFLSVGEDRSA